MKPIIIEAKLETKLHMLEDEKKITIWNVTIRGKQEDAYLTLLLE